jgi:hypothetical protein
MEDWDTDELDAGHGADPEVVAPDPELLLRIGLVERRQLLHGYVRAELGRVLGVPAHGIDTVGPSMKSLGVGSINGLELQRRMEAALGTDIDLRLLLRAENVDELIGRLADRLGPVAEPPRRTGRSGPLGSI